MKKRIVLPLIILGITLPLCVYLYMNFTLREFKINDKDSKLLKKYKLVYNNDLRLFNKIKQKKELINCYEEEAKKYKNDPFYIIEDRVLLNSLKCEDSQYDKSYIEELEKVYDKKILDTPDKKKKRKNLKITFDDLYKEKELKEKSLELYKDDKINEFASEYKKAFEENEKILLNSYDMTGEEFLKLNYREKWLNYLEKQTNILKNMKCKIKKLSKEKIERKIGKSSEIVKKDLGVHIKPIIDGFEKAPFNANFKLEKTPNEINKYIGKFKDEYGVVLELEGNEILKDVTLKIPETLIKQYQDCVNNRNNKNSKYIEDVSFELISKIFKNDKITTQSLLKLICWRCKNIYVNLEDKKIYIYLNEKDGVYEFKIKPRTKEEFDENEYQGYEIKEDKFSDFKQARHFQWG